MRQRRTREQWAQLIEQNANSGLSVVAYCAANDIGLASFNKWKHRLRKGVSERANENTSDSFQSVQLVQSKPSAPVQIGNTTITLSLGANITLTIDAPGSVG